MQLYCASASLAVHLLLPPKRCVLDRETETARGSWEVAAIVLKAELCMKLRKYYLMLVGPLRTRRRPAWLATS